MEDPLLGLNLGLQMAGALQGMVLIGFVLLRVRAPSLYALPVCYFAAVTAGFITPVITPVIAPEIGPGTLMPLRLLIGALPAFGYLLILQLLDDGLPHHRHFFVLAVPLIAIPAILLATEFGETEVCLTSDPVSCMAPAPLLTLYDALAGAGLLLALMFVAQHRLAAVNQRALGPEKRALVQAIIALMVVLLSLDIMSLAGLIEIEEAQFVASMIRLTFFYLVASAVFRVFPSAFALPEADEAGGGLIPRKAPAPEKRELNEEEEAQVARIRELMTLDKLYQEAGFSRKQLAAEMGLPEHQVSRLVNQGFGKSFIELVNSFRVEEAKQWLAETEEPISRIAFDVGFNSLASFNRVFKTQTGVNPSSWRDGERADGEAGVDAGPASLAAPATRPTG